MTTNLRVGDLFPDITLPNHLCAFPIYNGWYFVSRPNNEELRHDLRAIMQTRSDYRYEAYDTPQVRQIRIPQQEWEKGESHA